MKEKTIRAIQSLRFPFVVLIAMWAIHLVKVITGIPFVRLGILPRHIEGLKGILTAPLIHGDWAHLISNTVPFAVLSAIIFLFYRRVAVRSFLLIYLFIDLTFTLLIELPILPAIYLWFQGLP